MVNRLMICQAIVRLENEIDDYSMMSLEAAADAEIYKSTGLTFLTNANERLSNGFENLARRKMTRSDVLALLLLAAPRPTSKPAAIKKLSPTMKKAILQMAANSDTCFNSSNGAGTSATYASLFLQGLIEMDDSEAWEKGRFIIYRLTDSGRQVAENLAKSRPTAIRAVSVAVELPSVARQDRARNDFDDKQATEYIAAKIKSLQAVLVIDLDQYDKCPACGSICDLNGADICEDCIEARLDDTCPMCAGSGEAWIRVSELIDPRSPYGLKPERCPFCEGTGKRQ